MKDQNYFYAFGRIDDLNGVRRLKVFRFNHAFTQIEDLGLFNEFITNIDFTVIPHNIYSQAANQVFYLWHGQEPQTTTDIGAGRGYAFYNKITINTGLS